LKSAPFLPPVCQINGRRDREPHRRANSPSRHAAWCLRVCGLRAGRGRETGCVPNGSWFLSGGRGRPRDRRRVGAKARRKVGETQDAERENLSASCANSWFGRSAADLQAPRMRRTSKWFLWRFSDAYSQPNDLECFTAIIGFWPFQVRIQLGGRSEALFELPRSRFC
jgi:hypothetical protein